MTSEEIKAIAEALRRRDLAVTDGDVALKLADIDTAALRDQTNGRVTWELWDYETPINDMPPSHFLGRDDFPGGAVYLVRFDGQVILVQPHSPEVEGLVSMDESEARTMAERQVGAIVDDMVLGQTVDELEPLMRANLQPETAVVQPTSRASRKRLE